MESSRQTLTSWVGEGQEDGKAYFYEEGRDVKQEELKRFLGSSNANSLQINTVPQKKLPETEDEKETKVSLSCLKNRHRQDQVYEAFALSKNETTGQISNAFQARATSYIE